MANEAVSRTQLLRDRVGLPLKEILRSRVTVLLFLLTLHVLSAYAVLAPYIQELMRDFFASRAAKQEVNCVGSDSSYRFWTYCKEGSNYVMYFKVGADLINSLIFGIFLAPNLGGGSDLVGRKPFLILGFFTSILPAATIWIHEKFEISLYWYYPALLIAKALDPFLPAFSIVADIISPPSRTVAFALFGIVFSVAFSIGPALSAGPIDNPLTASYVALACGIGAFLGSAFFFRESLSPSQRQFARDAFRESRNASVGFFGNYFKKPFMLFINSFSILFRSKLFTLLSICILALYFNFEETIEMNSIYLLDVRQFDQKELGKLLAASGVAGLFVSTVVLYLLVSVFRMNDKHVLIFGMSVFIIQQVLFSFVESKAILTATAAIGTTANLVFPAISSIKSRIVTPLEQGALQGAMRSAQSVAKCLGGATYLGLFTVFRSEDRYFPGAPYVAGALVLVVGIAVAVTLELPSASPSSVEMGTKGDKPQATESDRLLKSFPIDVLSHSSGDD